MDHPRVPSVLGIPDAWLMGYCQAGHTIQQAVAYWIEQERLEADFQQSRRGFDPHTEESP